MRYAIFGDIHGNLEALEAVLADMQANHVTHAACVGDIVGEFANSRECLEIVRALGCPLVKGNQDESASGSTDRGRSGVTYARNCMTDDQRDFLRTQPLQMQVTAFTIVHSSLHRSSDWHYVSSSSEAGISFQQQKTDICFFGHTHIPHVFIQDTKVHKFSYKKIDVLPGKKYFVNVGSVGVPRDGDWRAAYVVYDISACTIELRRLPFDLEKARAKL